MIKKFNDYQKLMENITLLDDEKKYLWSKVEYRKKKTAIETENELFSLLNGDSNIDEENFKKILNSLEYTFRKKLKGEDKPMKSEIFQSIIKKIPSNWIGVNYSSLFAKKKSLERKPKISSPKSEILKYLDKNNIKYDPNMKKIELISLI